nr:hypothetical protein [Burkholderia multivorans]
MKLYTIVPLRAANARTLIEQSIGEACVCPTENAQASRRWTA